MNIFILDEDPVLAAQMQCDQHVVKMPLETAQILCTLYPIEQAPYRHTHYNHPCCIWARESSANYTWLVEHGLALCDEYTYRYQKTHAAAEVIYWCLAHLGDPQMGLSFPLHTLTPFKYAMEDQYRCGDVVSSYQNFYLKSKGRFARWNRNRNKPAFFDSVSVISP